MVGTVRRCNLAFGLVTHKPLRAKAIPADSLLLLLLLLLLRSHLLSATQQI